ncbi:MAG TPA: transcription antitermination factor NusB [Vicinamibacterales bacterium]|nr:transcription antitermination factor NusB [Vicinamibacterales bacterium]
MTARRHQAREAALQILYFWEVGKTEPQQAVEAYFREHQPEANDAIRTFASELVSGTVGDLEAIDKLIVQHSANWRLERLASIDRLILRMATWELQHQPDVPAAVVVDEALELARTFSTDDSVRFVNGVLDAIRQGLGR